LLLGLGCTTARAEMALEMRVASLDIAGPTQLTSQGPGQRVLAEVDLSDQTMRVYVGPELVHEFKVSTGRKGYGTPTGSYKVQWTHAKWFSRKYDMAPMPWSVFFHGGYAVHGTTAISRLGRPASHGCVRLDPKNAKLFYQLVRANGKEYATVNIIR
jgi:lipoprotein-anchoring transpeptidase ErfK/SrfK